MNKSVVENSHGSEEYLDAPPFEVKAGEIILGTLASIDADGNPLIHFPQISDGHSLVAVSTVAVTHQHVGRQVALLFVNGDLKKPMIIGFIHSPLYDLLENFSMLQSSSVDEQVDIDPFDGKKLEASESSTPIETLRVDGKRVLIEGQDEIVLTCGDSSITLTKAGKILIRGKYLVSRSSGVNRILGGSVQVN